MNKKQRQQRGGHGTASRGIGQLLIALAAGCTWVSTRMAWVTVTAYDDKAGQAVKVLSGSRWAAELGAGALIFVAALVGTFLVPRLAGIITAIVGAALSWVPVRVLVSVDVDKAHHLVTQTAENQHSDAPLAQWAEVTGATAHTPGPALAIVGCALGIVGGVLVALAGKKPRAAAASGKYEAPASRTEKVADDLEKDPDSGRVQWDALDAGFDPTDPDR